MKILRTGKKNLQEITKEILEGAIIVFPTDTVYGMICDATNKKSVLRIFKIKERPNKKVFSVLLPDIKTAKKFAVIPARKDKLLKDNKITGIFKAKKQAKKIFPAGAIGKDGKIGIRIPKYKLIEELFKKTERPLIGTSANISGLPSTTKIKKVINQFKNRKALPDFIFNAGNLKEANPSTVIDLTVNKFKIIRK
jgi:L-threonylcarbamoyladenylate synthase